MSIELRPLNVLCNIQCHYCYQHPQRDAATPSQEYDMTKMKEALLAEGGPFTMFGGEPLLMPLGDLEELWRWGYERFGRNQVQTNGILINDEHIRLFHQYAVHVGVSMDGPGDLNDVRWHGNVEKTRKSTEKSQAALERLCREGIYPSLIITLHRGNATEDRLPRLLDWVRALGKCGVRDINLHLLESESSSIRSLYALSEAENTRALLEFYRLSREIPEFRFEMFPGMKRLLMADDRATQCVWYACDPYTTRAVRGVEGQGQRSNCGRTNKDGVDFVKAASPGFERYIALYQTPQADGGCQGCRFFMMCKGQCPGTALDGDWRNRTEHCEVWKTVYETLEAELVAEGKTPLSLSPLRKQVEEYALDRWRLGREVSMSTCPSASPAPGFPQPPVHARG
jgi:uncharacterized protein